MTDHTKTEHNQTATYQVRAQGNLSERWLPWFDDLIITVETGCDSIPTTTLTGPVQDQASLRGILNKLWDLNLAVISVTRLG